MAFTHRNIKADVEDIGSVFDGSPDLEFRAATRALELEQSGLTISGSHPAIGFRTATRTTRRRRCTWSCGAAGG